MSDMVVLLCYFDLDFTPDLCLAVPARPSILDFSALLDNTTLQAMKPAIPANTIHANTGMSMFSPN